jgi:hypothetical protein
VAIWRVEELLRKVTEALNRAGVPYAVVGGNAVAAWVATVDPDAIRATKDVDLLARRSDLPALGDALRPIGLIEDEILGVKIFVEREDPSPKRGVHMVIANERIRANYAHPAPDVTERTTTIADYPVIDLPALVAMKLQSYRLIDRAHIVDLKAVDLITPELIDKLPEDLRERLREIPEPDWH